MNPLGSVNIERTASQILMVIDHKTIPEPNTGCLLWTGGSDKDGYGKIYFQKKHWRVHRLIFELKKKQQIPPGNLIQHICDTPSCCNIDHLKLGTPLSNMQDKVKKGRLRNQNMGKVFCKRGHNISLPESYYFNGSRHCKECFVDRRSLKKNLKNLRGNK